MESELGYGEGASGGQSKAQVFWGVPPLEFGNTFSAEFIVS